MTVDELLAELDRIEEATKYPDFLEPDCQMAARLCRALRAALTPDLSGHDITDAYWQGVEDGFTDVEQRIISAWESE